MKSCIMAAWLLTVSFGNLIVVILTGVKLTDDMVRNNLLYCLFSVSCCAQIRPVSSYLLRLIFFEMIQLLLQAQEFIFFAVFLAIVSAIFSVMAYFYKYVNYGSSRGEEDMIPLTDANEEEDAEAEEREGREDPALPPSEKDEPQKYH